MIPLEDLLVRKVWLSIIIWGVVYISDYYLTIYSASLYTTVMKEKIAFGGSFELTPQFQKDIDALHRFSPRFVLALILSSLVLVLLWYLAVAFLGLPQLFAFAIGGMILRELAVHVRHVRNIALFRGARIAGGLSGKVEYARWLTLKISATELMTLGSLFFLVYLTAGSWLFLGGAVFTLATGVRHWSWSRELYRHAQGAAPRGKEAIVQERN